MVPTIFLGTAFGKIGRFFFFPFWRLGDYPYCSCRDNIKFGITYIFVMVIVNCACYVTWMFWLISLAPSVLHSSIYNIYRRPPIKNHFFCILTKALTECQPNGGAIQISLSLPYGPSLSLYLLFSLSLSLSLLMNSKLSAFHPYKNSHMLPMPS